MQMRVMKNELFLKSKITGYHEQKYDDTEEKASLKGVPLSFLLKKFL
jgi:hypothetical protein